MVSLTEQEKERTRLELTGKRMWQPATMLENKATVDDNCQPIMHTHKQFEYSHKRENHGPVEALHPPVNRYEVRSEYGHPNEDTEGKDEG